MMHQSSHLAALLPRDTTTWEEKRTEACTLVPASIAQKAPSPHTCTTHHRPEKMLCLMVPPPHERKEHILLSYCALTKRKIENTGITDIMNTLIHFVTL